MEMIPPSTTLTTLTQASLCIPPHLARPRLARPRPPGSIPSFLHGANRFCRYVAFIVCMPCRAMPDAAGLYTPPPFPSTYPSRRLCRRPSMHSSSRWHHCWLLAAGPYQAWSPPTRPISSSSLFFNLCPPPSSNLSSASFSPLFTPVSPLTHYAPYTLCSSTHSLVRPRTSFSSSSSFLRSRLFFGCTQVVRG